MLHKVPTSSLSTQSSKQRIDLRDARVAVTGGAGFIGSHLVDGLAELDPEGLVVVDNFFLGSEENLLLARSIYPELAVENIDASDFAALEAAVARHSIDVVFDLATVPLPYSLDHPLEAVEINTALATSVAELARLGAFQTLIHFSSSEVYGSAVAVPMTEEHPIAPATPYAAGKAAGDHVVQSYINTFDIDATIIRPFNNYGPRQNDGSYAGVIPIAVGHAFEGKPMPIHGDGKQTRDFVYVEDTVRGTLMAYAQPETRGRAINLATEMETTILDLVRAVYAGARTTVAFDHLDARPGDVRRHLGSRELAHELFGFAPSVGLSEGMERTVSWYREHSLNQP